MGQKIVKQLFHQTTVCLIMLMIIWNCQSVVTPFDNPTTKLVIEHKTPSIFLLTGNKPKPTSAQTKSQILQQFHSAADQYYKLNPNASPQNTDNHTQRLLFILSDPNDGLFTYDGLVEMMGVEECVEKRGSCVVYRDGLGNKYLYDQSDRYVSGKMLEFIGEVRKGRHAIFYKSEPLEHYEASKSKIVRNLVGLNFNQIIGESIKQQFVLFYTPYCHKSRALLNYFYKTAESIKKNTNIKFSKINLLKNEIPLNPSLHSLTFQTDIQSETPFLYLFRKDKSKPAIKFMKLKPYESSYDYLLKWLKENTEFQWVRSEEPSKDVYEQL